MKHIPFIDLSFQTQAIYKSVQKEWDKIINSSSFVMGKYLDDFEKSFSQFTAIKHTIGVGNGGDAIELTLRSLNLPKDSKIFLPVNTFIATATAVTRAGYDVRFIDVNKDDGLINFENLFSNKLTNKSCVIPVHLFGFMVDVSLLKKNLGKNNKIIEDASQAHGAKFNNLPPGTHGQAATYSFYPGKNLGAFGDGGAISTSLSSVEKKVSLLRNYGSIKKYQHDIVGFNSRLDPMQAVVLKEKLKHLDKWNNIRRQNYKKYRDHLKDMEHVELIKEPKFSQSVFHLTVAKVKNRANLIKYLDKNKISTIIHYPVPLHKTKAYKNYNFKKGEFKNAEKMAGEILSLPNYPGMTNQQISYVCEKINNFYNN